MLRDVEYLSKFILAGQSLLKSKPSESQFTVDYTKVLLCHQWKCKVLRLFRTTTAKKQNKNTENGENV